jgi:hypothetical protein
MTYPALSKVETEKYVSGRREGALTENDLHADQRGDESEGDYEAIVDLLDSLLDEWGTTDLTKIKSDQARDAVEGKLAVKLHKSTHDLPGRLLSDRDFWRYCAAHLFDLVEWRNGSGCSLDNYGAKLAGAIRECMPHRMFDRANIAYKGGLAVGEKDPYALAKFGASDVWRSHIIRVLNGNAPIVAHEILADVKTGSLKTNVIRPFIRNVRRARANVLFELLDLEHARDLVNCETNRILQSID